MSMFVDIHKALMYYSFSFPSEPYQIDFSLSIWVCLKAGHPEISWFVILYIHLQYPIQMATAGCGKKSMFGHN